MRADLPQDMLAAADTLEEASQLYDYLSPTFADWSAESLRHEAYQLGADL